MPMKILIFDVDPARANEMKECLMDRFFMYEVCLFTDEAAMVECIAFNWDQILLASVFHDIEKTPSPAGPWRTPGSGYDMLDWLEMKTPTSMFPIILHSTDNQNNLPWYERLKGKQWRVELVNPLTSLDQVFSEWFPVARKLILETAALPTAQTVPQSQTSNI